MTGNKSNQSVEIVEMFSGCRSDGSPVHEELLCEPLGENQYRLLRSPGLVLGLAADDIFKKIPNGLFDVVTRGGNLCIQIFHDGISEDVVKQCSHDLSSINAMLDGSSDKELVYTVGVEHGFDFIEKLLNHAVAKIPSAEWYYGNVYDALDGVTPLNWWIEQGH